MLEGSESFYSGVEGVIEGFCWVFRGVILELQALRLVRFFQYREGQVGALDLFLQGAFVVEEYAGCVFALYVYQGVSEVQDVEQQQQRGYQCYYYVYRSGDFFYLYYYAVVFVFIRVYFKVFFFVVRVCRRVFIVFFVVIVRFGFCIFVGVEGWAGYVGLSGFRFYVFLVVYEVSQDGFGVVRFYSQTFVVEFLVFGVFVEVGVGCGGKQVGVALGCVLVVSGRVLKKGFIVCQVGGCGQGFCDFVLGLVLFFIREVGVLFTVIQTCCSRFEVRFGIVLDQFFGFGYFVYVLGVFGMVRV